jgi:hypothetical protein
MNEKTLIAIALSLIVFLSCTSTNECLPADSIKQIKSFDVNSHAYFIYVRISGAQTEETFFELYDNVPVFDDCGKPNIAIISTARVDSAQGSVSKLIIDDHNLKIVYKKNQSEEIRFDNIPIEIKRH